MEAEVLFDYEKEQEDELDLEVGKIITNVIQADDGWCEGTCDGKRGLFPDNFVRIKKPTSTAAMTTAVKPAKPPPQNPAPSSPPVVTRAAAQKSKSRRAKVTFSYAAENPDELTLQPGQFVDVLGEEEDGWWRGQMGDKVGLFPSNFVEVTQEDAMPTPAPSGPAHSQETADGPPPHLPPDKPRPPMAAPVGGMGLGPRFNPLEVKLKPTPHPHPHPPAKEKEQPKKPELKKAPPRAAPSKPPALPPQEADVERAKVVFAYTSEQEDELTIQTGDVLEVIDKTEQDGWWKVKLNGRVGLVPDNFVELLPSEPVAAEPAPAKREHRRPPPTPTETEEPSEKSDFGVPATEILDSSAVKERPHRPVGTVRPPSRSNLHPDEPDPATGAGGGGVGGGEAAEEAPWQRELKQRKKKVPVKLPSQKTHSDLPEKKPPPPRAPTKPLIGERPGKPKPPPTKPVEPVKPPAALISRPSPPSSAALISSTQPPKLSPSKPSEASPEPLPPSTGQSVEELREALEKLRQEFAEFKAQVRRDVKKEIQTLSDDLDEERKNNASLKIDVDRLKKMQL